MIQLRDVLACGSPPSNEEHPVPVLEDSIGAVDPCTTCFVSNLSLEEELLLSEINDAVVEFSDF